ncbi:MAG: septum formation protein Maf [Rickettsiales bacterium]|nr:septum formation protein Maf [Rickettsiales bacterium]
MTDIILASGSKNRLELLNKIGVFPKLVQPADIDETPLKKEKPEDYVQRVAREKVEFVAKYHKNENILSADSIVSVNNRIIQKPKDVEDVKSFLKLYSGKNIKLYTAVYLIKKDGSISKKLVLTKAKFKHLNQRDLEDVLKEKNNAINYSCAGGLSVEGYIECFIKRIDGSYSNIIGLPLYDVRNMLISAGIY